MKAAAYFRYGPPANIQIQNLPKPEPKPGEVLIKVHATTVNRTDCALLRAKPFIMRFVSGLTKPGHPILGTDFAGVIESAGKAVSNYKAGDRVFGFNDSGARSQAEYMVANPNKTLAKIPDGTGFQQAAASIEGFHYALNFINKVRLQSGHTVLVNGATGAIGSALVQLCKHFKVNVTATCRAAHSEVIRSLGASQTIHYDKQDFTKHGETFDYVFDAVGKSAIGRCKPVLKPKGVYISSELGPKMQNLPLSLFSPFIPGPRVKFPLPLNLPASLNLVRRLSENDEFKPLIDRTYSLDRVADAYQYTETGRKVGNVILKISD